MLLSAVWKNLLETRTLRRNIFTKFSHSFCFSFLFLLERKLELKCKIWDGEMVQLFRTFVAFAEDLWSIPHGGPKPPVTSIQFKTMFWLPQSPGMHIVHIHICRHNTCTNKIKYINLSKIKSYLVLYTTSKFCQLLPSVWNRDREAGGVSFNISLYLYFPESLAVHDFFMFYTFFCLIFNENDNFIRTRKIIFK